MRLFARGKGWEIYQGDSLSGLRELAAAGLRADCLLTDAPYSSGSTGEAAIRTGRRAVLVEATKEYCERAL